MPCNPFLGCATGLRGTMRKMTAFKDTIPDFMRRPRDLAPVKHEIEFKKPNQAPPLRPRPRNVIHGGVPPLQPSFLSLAAGEQQPTAPASSVGPAPIRSPDESAVVDLTARRGAVARVEPAPRLMNRALHAAFEAETGNFGDNDAAFQVTLPRSVIRQIRLFAAEQGTTHRAVVLRALRTAGLSIPEGADVDRRAVAAKRRHQA